MRGRAHGFWLRSAPSRLYVMDFEAKIMRQLFGHQRAVAGRGVALDAEEADHTGVRPEARHEAGGVEPGEGLGAVGVDERGGERGPGPLSDAGPLILLVLQLPDRLAGG